MQTISENDLKVRIIDLLKDGWENIDYVKCLFFTWVEMFDAEDKEISNMLNEIFTGSMIEVADRDELFAELSSMIL